MMANLHNVYCFREVTSEVVSHKIFSQPYTMEVHSFTRAIIILRLANWALVSFTATYLNAVCIKENVSG